MARPLATLDAFEAMAALGVRLTPKEISVDPPFISSERHMTISNPIYRRTPVVHEALADLDTPLSVYLKLAKGPYSYLLESAQGGEKWGVTPS